MQQPSPYTTRPTRKRSSRSSRSQRIRFALLAGLMLSLAQLLWPVQVQAATLVVGAVDEPVLLAAAELETITGGCTRDCDGDDDDSGGGGGGGSSGGRNPDKVGRPYWERSHQVVISRTEPKGDLVWQQKNSTNRELGPFTVRYESKNALSWSISGGVPSGIVKGDVGAQHSRSFMVSASYTIPPKTYYKLYVAYPTERKRHYYKKWQDYDDNSRDQVGSGSVTSTKRSTTTNIVDGRVN